jgi:hypothetical protein
MEHLSDNELIAEFMGFSWCETDHDKFWNPLNAPQATPEAWEYHTNHLDQFRTSWDWLMPVVEKIESVRAEDDLYFSVEINRNGCRIYRSWTTSQDKHFGWHQTGNKLRSTYAAVVEFIKWYNKQSN